MMTDQVSIALEEGKKACVDCGYWFTSKAQLDKHKKRGCHR